MRLRTCRGSAAQRQPANTRLEWAQEVGREGVRDIVYLIDVRRK